MVESLGKKEQQVLARGDNSFISLLVLDNQADVLQLLFYLLVMQCLSYPLRYAAGSPADVQVGLFPHSKLSWCTMSSFYCWLTLAEVQINAWFFLSSWHSTCF